MRRLILLFLVLSLPCVFAQTARVVLAGHLRAGAVAENDRGRVDASRVLQHVSLILQPSAAQQTELSDFLTRLQDPASPDYHQWLTPEQYGARFGPAQADIDGITAWLTSQNLTLDSVSRGRTTISFTGSVRNIENAFQIEIHNYSVNGETHFANASEPSVPAAVAGRIRAIHGLDDFRLKPLARLSPGPVPSYTSVTTGRHYLAPSDVSTVFDITPVYNSGITGKGQSLVVVGQTKINLSDIEEFRTYFNLSANDPQVLLVPGAPDPGVSANDLPEADLDVEWSGAIARDASIIYVYSNDVETSLDYAIGQNLAPVITMSYGECEALAGTADLGSLNLFAQQASAQGISWINASGDNGANDCYGQSSRVPAGLSVDAPASVPLVTGIGGTTLTEGSGSYWSAANDANHASAISYIPENVWNDSVQDGSPSAGGGGVSTFFAKPSWQAGTGVPADGMRDVPDIALPGSADHDAYLVYTGGTLEAFGGTSVGAPVFAGMAGLLNQYLLANGLQTKPGVGSMNPRLYALAQASPGVFHDITIGDNMVNSCNPASRGCSAVLVGYTAGVGYDQASGLGSVDAFNLITSWQQNGSAAKAGAAVQLTSSITSLLPTDTTILTATVTSAAGTTPTGTITFYAAGVSNSLGSVSLTGSGLTASATLSVTAARLGSATTVSAIYSGDGVYAIASATVPIAVAAADALVLNGISSAASFQRAYSPGMIVSLFGQNLAGSIPDLPGSPLPTVLAGTTVTINGIAAPLYYVSPTQVNLQIPYAIPANSTAIVRIAWNGQSATSQVPVAAHAPEVFADTDSLLVPYQTTGRGQTIFLFATGDGLFTAPAVTTGSVPAAGTLTTLPVDTVVTVGGVAGNTTFVGVPSWSIGVTQVNFTIPAGAPLGLQPVVVTVAGVPSAPVYITVTP